MESSFKFKRFSVLNGEAGLKVGTDGVLLGAVAGLDFHPERILDIGTGTGVVALMLAQRTEDSAATITGIDISSKATAAVNFACSPWAERLEYINISLAYYMDSDPQAFDLIVSNPPYYDNSLECPDSDRNLARHIDEMSYREVITFSNDFLSEEGRLSLVLPRNEEPRLMRFAASFGFFPIRVTYIRTRDTKGPSRIVAEFSRTRTKMESVWLTMSDAEGYTDEYRQLTKDFYLNF